MEPTDDRDDRVADLAGAVAWVDEHGETHVRETRTPYPSGERAVLLRHLVEGHGLDADDVVADVAVGLYDGGHGEYGEPLDSKVQLPPMVEDDP